MNTLTPTPGEDGVLTVGKQGQEGEVQGTQPLVPSQGPVPGLGILSTGLLWEETASKI